MFSPEGIPFPSELLPADGMGSDPVDVSITGAGFGAGAGFLKSSLSA